jgi:alkylation response protein AidB-like acyl-CoA dehydrogenase
MIRDDQILAPSIDAVARFVHETLVHLGNEVALTDSICSLSRIYEGTYQIQQFIIARHLTEEEAAP